MDDEAAIDIGERLAALYRAIRSGPMRDMPVCNDALDVAAIGFRPFGEWAIGVVVTPWMMNIVCAQETGVAPAARRRMALPAGDVDFVASRLDGFGTILSCSLFSPMFEFTDMASACETARAAIGALFDQAFFDAPPARTAPTLDRRALLRGRLSEAPA